MLIPNKFNGYARDGRREYHFGGGSGGSATQTQVTDLPGWAKPTAERTLTKTEALTTDRPFKSFAGQYDQAGNQIGFDPSKAVAGFRDLQTTAFQGAKDLQTSSQLGQATGLAGTAAQRALGMGYDPLQASFMETQAPQLQQFQMGPAERVRADMFGGRQAAQYMSPFMEQALEPQLREAQRSSEMQRNVNQAQAVGQGAFGGSRQAIIEAERQRNLGTQMGDIRARGLQSAYEQAQNQFNQDAARRLQAQQLNQQAGLTVGGQNLQSLLGVQQLGAQTGMQSQLANQQAFQNARQLAEQSRQFGGSLGLQGLQTALQGAGQLGQFGQQEFGQQKDILGLQNQFGSQQQAQEQALINARAQDFASAQRYPYQQLEFMSNILRGTPMGSVQTMYQAPPNPLSQLIGAGTSLYGAHLMGGGGRKEGGIIGSYAKGGSVSDAKVKREKKKSAGLAELALSKI
jgi:hypothetical protein